MTTSERIGAGAAHALFEGDEVREVLRDTFFRSEATAPATDPTRRPRRAKGPAKTAPKTELSYEVICISMYREDLAALDQKVRDLKAHGHPKMSRSALIRFALAHVDTSALPRSW